MRRNLHQIIGRVRVRLLEERDDNFVDSLAGRGFNQLTEDRACRFQFARQAQHRCGNRARLRTGETHNANASAPGRSGNGDDGVVEIHDCWIIVLIRRIGRTGGITCPAQTIFAGTTAGLAPRLCSPWERPRRDAPAPMPSLSVRRSAKSRNAR